jgi:hypothetical protein
VELVETAEHARADEAPPPEGPLPSRGASGWRTRGRKVRAWLHAHESLLWWLHSVWALAFGIGVMWLGARNFTYLRVAILHVSFIWATSLVLPFVLRSARLSPTWRGRVRLVVNYFNKNFYQQLLFFILPIYALSTTTDSVNVLTVVVLGTCAVLSTLDPIYDRHLSVRRLLTAALFACTVFGGVAAALPMLWGVPPETAVRVAGGAAAFGVMTLLITERRADWQRSWFVGGLMMLALALLVEYGRVVVPPTPLRLASSTFGTDIDRSGLVMRAPLDHLAPDHRGPVYVLTSIYAPLGLHDRVRHVWYVDGTPVWASRWYDVDGGRTEGYRLWTGRGTLPLTPGSRIHVDVETEGGQLIGRARLGPR